MAHQKAFGFATVPDALHTSLIDFDLEKARFPKLSTSDYHDE